MAKKLEWIIHLEADNGAKLIMRCSWNRFTSQSSQNEQENKNFMSSVEAGVIC